MGRRVRNSFRPDVLGLESYVTWRAVISRSFKMVLRKPLQIVVGVQDTCVVVLGFFQETCRPSDFGRGMLQAATTCYLEIVTYSSNLLYL
jgi:hypothetical protein